MIARRNFLAKGRFAEKVYLAIAYEKEITEDDMFGFKVARIKMWEKGHSFDEIDNMGVDDLGHVLAYWSGKSLGENKLARENKHLGGR